MCECPSTSPGMRVAPVRSTTLAPAVLMLAAGPAASMRFPFTRTAHPSRMVSPSNTRAGRRTVCPNAEAASRAARTLTRNRFLTTQNPFDPLIDVLEVSRIAAVDLYRAAALVTDVGQRRVDRHEVDVAFAEVAPSRLALAVREV